jgi:uncharacterized delta-60 repeat protein
MKHRLTIYTVYILLAGLLGFLPAVNAAPGDLDTTFSLDGKIVETIFGASRNQAQATAVQADGKIVIAGAITFGNTIVSGSKYGCGIARYNTNGSLDLTFDEDGKIYGLIGTTFTCRAVAIQTDGKIVVAGGTSPTGSSDFALIRFNPNGSRDTSFGTGGQVTTNIAGYDSVNGIAIQPDGKIVAAGVSNTGGANFALARYNPNGSLDTSFDGDGKVSTDFWGSNEQINAVAIQADGKIVAAGYILNGSPNSDQDFALIRYNADGSLDTSFDGDGKLTTSVSDSHNGSRANAVAIQADGKIVAAGFAYLTVNQSSSAKFGLARYNPDGSLDTSFDGDGKVITDSLGISNSASAVAIQADGKIVAAGYSYDAGAHFALARYNTDGSLDTSFDGDGVVTTLVTIYGGYGYAVALQTDGKMVAGGYAGNAYDEDFALVRYNPDGSLDTSFDADGKTTIDMGYPAESAANAVAIQADGKIVVGGESYNGRDRDFTLVRYNRDGSLDTSFDGDGKLTTDILGGINGDHVNALAIQPDGKIVAAGYSYSGNVDFSFVRYNANGSLDGSFGGYGIVTTSISDTTYDYIYAVAIQTDGKIVAAGYSYNGSNNDISLIRLNPDGSLDNSFDGDGKVTTQISNSYEAAYGMAIQTDGKIIVAGNASTDPGSDFALVRYNPDGSLDTSFDGDGKVTTDVTGVNEGANSVVIQTDGKIVAGGSTSNDFGLVRYNTDGSLDTSFDGDGKVFTHVLGTDRLSAIEIQANGKIVAGGFTYPGGNNNEGAVVRYNSDGSLDNSFGTGGKRTFDMLGGSNDFIYGMTLDSIGRAVLVGETNHNITVVRIRGDLAQYAAPFDFDGDGKTDISIFRPAVGEWWYLKSSNGGNAAFGFGNSADKLVPGDYTGDGKTDIAIFRPSTGEWFILRSENVSYYSFPFGASGDVPVPSDFDGDGKTDAGVFRPSTQTWYISQSSGGTRIEQFGASGDVPAVGDYDGDGKTDIGIYRVSLGEWWIKRSSDNVAFAFHFGTASDKPVQGDYTGDGKTDAAFWRASTGEWFILRSEFLSYYSVPFGASGDVPVPGDYDGDGKFDTAVFRPASSTWYVNRTTAGLLIANFGANGDVPVPSAFVR